MNNDKIDFVITWVDGSDKKWIKDYNTYSEKKIEEHRYRDWGILKYWFRAIEKNAEWVNKVYFVTYGHIPKWLNTSYEKLVIVNHRDIIDEKYLPTFNSCVIEANLHKIKGLSEKFVYFNDDMYIINKTEPTDFYINGLPCDNKIIKPIWYRGKTSTLINYNCSKIVNKHFKENSKFKNKLYYFSSIKNIIKTFVLFKTKHTIGFYPQHVPTSYLKKTFNEVWKKEEKLLSKICMNKFRTENDVSQWLFQFWQIASNNYIERNKKLSKYYEIKSSKIDNCIKEIKNKKYKLICLNDSEITNDYQVNKEKIIEMFESLYKEKSKYEV